jgi:hypothetical protein
MHHMNVLTPFKLKWDEYKSTKAQDDSDIPTINDKDNEQKVIKWVPIFLDCASYRTYGSRGPLACVLHELTTLLKIQLIMETMVA